MEEQKPAADIVSIYRRAAEIADDVSKAAEKYKLFITIDGVKYLRAESLQASMVLAWTTKELIPQAPKKADPKKGDTTPTIRNRLFAILKFVEKDSKKARALFTALTGKEKSHEVADGVIESLVSALHRVKEGSAEIRTAGTYVWIHDKPTDSSLFGNRPPPPAPTSAAPAPPVAPPASAPPVSEPPAEMDPF